MHSVHRFRAGLVASLLVAACTGSNGHVARSACDLLTTNEVEHVTGATVLKSGPTQLMVDPTSSTSIVSAVTACSFDTNGPFGAVLVVLQRPGLRAFDAERVRAPAPGDPSSRVDVPGLGDRAFSWGEHVVVVIGETYVSVSSQNETVGFSTIAIQLARIALTRAV